MLILLSAAGINYSKLNKIEVIFPLPPSKKITILVQYN